MKKRSLSVTPFLKRTLSPKELEEKKTLNLQMAKYAQASLLTVL